LYVNNSIEVVSVANAWNAVGVANGGVIFFSGPDNFIANSQPYFIYNPF